ncbi:HU family DNA-binding protein [Desulfovibrio litoralis]|uniref:DNA-binding protein HU-beta n=1 Tax=Desulfovibrio litoralis DSM 11393 TaxID=1121455 RepID=A0A1M7S071_9BACT|nr:HU family DNA-binding protein [Desulfovibrio litoralis]SHN51826.1 DNA-binding protein HU-beta [Desulfovibrio litoralis DSM 11393]
MTKADLVDKIAAKSETTKVSAERALNAFIESVQEILVQEGKLTLTGFGTFVVEGRKERIGRNPRTREPITIPAVKVVKFRPGKILKESVK